MQDKKPKKLYDIKPKMKHKNALLNMVDNGGNVSKAMIDAGYSPNTARTPSKMTTTKGFVSLLDSIGLDEQEIGTILKRHAKSSDKRASLQALKMIMQSRGLLKHQVTFERSESEEYQGLD